MGRKLFNEVFFQFFKKSGKECSIYWDGRIAIHVCANDIIVFKELHPTGSTVFLLIVYIILAIVFASIYMELWTGEWYLRGKKKKKSYKIKTFLISWR